MIVWLFVVCVNLCYCFSTQKEKNSETSKCNQMDWWRFGWGFNNSIALRIRPGCGCFGAPLFCVFKHSLILHVISFNCCWCWLFSASWILKVYIWLRQSASRSMDLILLLDAPQHRQLDFYFVTSIMDEVGRKYSFQYSVGWRIRSDVQQFVKDLFWWVQFSFF